MVAIENRLAEMLGICHMSARRVLREWTWHVAPDAGRLVGSNPTNSERYPPFTRPPIVRSCLQSLCGLPPS
jgi:hypothetical protein